MRCLPALTLVCASSLLLSNPAQAQADDSVSYNYAELSYVRSNVEIGGPIGDVDGNGGRFAFSAEFLESFYAVGAYETIDLDDIVITNPVGGGSVTSATLDVDTWRVGVGWHSRLSNSSAGAFKSARDRWSMFAQAEYVSFDSGGSSTLDGYSVKVGARGINHTNFEFIGAIGYEELDNSDGEFVFEGRLTYDITNNFEAQFGVDYVEDFVRGFVGVRYHFSGLVD